MAPLSVDVKAVWKDIQRYQIVVSCKETINREMVVNYDNMTISTNEDKPLQYSDVKKQKDHFARSIEEYQEGIMEIIAQRNVLAETQKIASTISAGDPNMDEMKQCYEKLKSALNRLGFPT